MELWISLFIVVSIYSFFSKKTGSLTDPYTIFFIAFLYYAYFIPIGARLFGGYHLGEIGVFINDQDIFILSIIFSFSFLFFSIGLRFGDYIVNKFDYPGMYAKLDQGLYIKRCSYILATAILVFLIFYFSELSVLMSGYSSKVEIIYNNYAFNLFKFVILIGTTIFANYLTLNKPYGIAVSIVFSIIMIFISFLTFSKEPMILAFFNFTCLLSVIVRKHEKLTLAGLIVSFFIVLFYVIPVFSFYRFSGEVAFFDPSNADFANLYSDARGPFVTILFAMRYDQSFAIVSLAESFFLWVPRFIWESRPVDLAESFAQATIVNWQPGQGYGFSPITEAILRFGKVLAPLFFIIEGFVFGVMQLGFAKFLPKVLRMPAHMSIGAYTAFMINRGPFSIILTTQLQFWLPFIAILLLGRLITPSIKPRSRAVAVTS